MSAAVRQAVANALASEWGEEDGPHPWRYFQALRDLSAYVPKPRRYGLGKWRVRTGDSAVAILTYRGGKTPQIAVPPDVRPELRERIMKATAAAIATAASGHAVRDTMPLALAASGGGDARLETRFGWTPLPGAAVATFALRESQPNMRAGFLGLRYPEEYRARNIEGSVLAAFILTDSGAVEPNSVRVVSSDGDLFTKNVREFLARARYTPYTLDCLAIPLVTGQEFKFSLRR